MPKKVKKKLGKRQCSLKGCRKYREAGKNHCRLHVGGNGETDATADPFDAVKRLSEIDRLRFLELDTAIRNEAQAIKILQLEQEVRDKEYLQAKAGKQLEEKQLNVSIASQHVVYRELLEELGKRYKFNPDEIIIDDKSGVLRVEKQADGG